MPGFESTNIFSEVNIFYRLHESTDGLIQFSVIELIWGVLQEFVRIIAETFETNDERVLDALIYRSETFKHLYQLKVKNLAISC